MIQRISVAVGWLTLVFILRAMLSPAEIRLVVIDPHLKRLAAFALMGLALLWHIPTACCSS